MSRIRRTMNNLVHVVGGELLLRAANAGIAVLIGRVYGVAELGNYAGILALATVAERLADNGLELTGIAEVSRQPRKLSGIATALYVDKTALSVAAIGLLAVVAWIVGLPGSRWPIAAVLTARTFVYSYCRLNAGLLKALDKTRFIASIQAFHFVLLTICALTVYLSRQSLLTLVLFLLATQTVEFVLTCLALRRLGLRNSFSSFSLCWHLLRRSTPVGMTYTLSTLMLRGDVVVLSLIASSAVVGTFAAANTGLVMVYVVAWLFSGVLLSDFASLSREGDTFEVHFRKCLLGVVVLGVPFATVSALLARLVIVTVFGMNFEAAGLPGVLMMVALPFIFLNATFLSRAIARNASRFALAIHAFTAILSLLLNYFLGHWYGAVGVAGSIVLREAVMTLAYLRFWNLPDRPAEAAVPLKANPGFAAMLNS